METTLYFTNVKLHGTTRPHLVWGETGDEGRSGGESETARPRLVLGRRELGEARVREMKGAADGGGEKLGEEGWPRED